LVKPAFYKIFMIFDPTRLKSAFKAMGAHFGGSALVLLAVAALVFGIWFPHPYGQLAGGTELFLLVFGVDLVCGPLLTLILYNPTKPKRELFTDLSLVVFVQLGALAYGIWTVHVARPLYLVHEVDRFKVIARVDVDASELNKLPESMLPQWLNGPKPVGLREASSEERNKVMFESVVGGRDYGERPSFYAKYDGIKAYEKALPVSDFVKKHPERQGDLDKLAGGDTHAVTQWRYLPIVARQDWVTVLDRKGMIIGYLQGDGF
jgi:hypothetical protein